jgi:hypothetical protein
MILGIQLLPIYLVIGGLTTLTFLVVEVLIGLRVIHFHGATHLRVHKILAYVLLVVAVLHGTLGLTFAFGWRILS